MSSDRPGANELGLLLPELVDTAATGAVHVDGAPGGILYLDEGRISYAESPATPGVGQRLMASGRLPEAVWRATYRAGHADGQVGRLLVEHGHLVPGELVSKVLAATYDAGYVLLCDEHAPARFAAGARHWLGVVALLTVEDLERETLRRRRLLRETPVDPTPIRPPSQPAMVSLDAVAQPGGLPRRLPVRKPEVVPAAEPAPPRNAPDYATLKRIRAALKAVT